ncbi:hypothetical protein Rhe02_69550 [Rhizocola hellebori]|uniref:Ig-like domain-containing protein n=1 Tax=Rhizocola hellebori TaxID=1392758 RepID=A0A8J3QG58_9ACTN|nr:hypothetical protein [Rhizocola hellebori]GIH08888.1 hypothetical protein Rhe02_69550 [Rhizocola hellebori]
MPTADSNPYAVTTGPDGSVWFSELTGTHRIGRITLAGQITEYNTEVNQIASLVAGPDSALWYVTSSGNSGVVGRMTTDGAFTSFSLGSSTDAYGLTAGPDGALWFGMTVQGQPKVGRITTGGDVTSFTVPVSAYEMTANPQISAITTGPDGALWFLFEGRAEGNDIPVVEKIGRVSLDGQFTLYPLGSELKGLVSIVAGSDGALWFTEYRTHKIGRMTTDGEVAEYDAGPNPFAITSAPDGTLWYTGGDNAVNRITLAPFGISAFYSPNLESALRQITAGPGNSLWFADQSSAAGGNHIGRISLDTPAMPIPQGLTAPQEWVRAASFSWQSLPGTNHYNVCRDGIMIDSTSQPSYTDTQAVVEGPHTYTVTAVDQFGQESWHARQIQIGVDNTAPSISNVAWTLNPIVAGDNTTLTADVADHGLGVVRPVQYRVDGGPAKPMTLSRGKWRAVFSSGLGSQTDLPNGNHAIEIVAGDSIGNVSVFTTQLVVGLPSPTNLAATSPTGLPVLTWQGVTNADHYDVYRDSILLGSTTSLVYSDNTANDGSHSYHVVAVDAFGSTGAASNTITVVVDKTGPAISALTWTSNPLSQGQPTQLSVAANDNLTNVASVEYTVDGNARQPLGYDAATNTWKAVLGANLAVNTYNIEVFVTDGVGNESVGVDVLAVYNATNGYVTGHAKVLPNATDTLPIARDASNNPAKVIVGFTNVKAATSTTPTSGSFDLSYVVKNNKDEFSISSTSVDWLVVPDSLHASILGHATLTVYNGGVQTTTANVSVRFDLTLGSAGSPDHLKIRIYDPGIDPSAAPHWVIDDDVLANGSHLMIRQ